ncbi:MAG: hypothetical protein EOP53_03480 [Sphingobacteriales bacterium]|nr:MAG: hypothetical protein EOP53_03480 [Sphingobacteriales bacterium]
MKTLITLFLITVGLGCFAQQTFKKNDLYLEAGGASLFGGLNYERQLTKEPGLAARIGIGFYTEKAFYLSTPIGLHYLFPLNKNKGTFIDAGIATTFTWHDAKLFNKTNNNADMDFVNVVPGIGYRKHSLNNVMWRISFSPIINKNVFFPWLGFSVGKRF